MGAEGIRCQICSADGLLAVREFATLSRVTSDCKPFPPGGTLFVCKGCGLIQKTRDERWMGEVEQIYREYDIYHQSAGIEQAVFDATTGCSGQRSVVLVERLHEVLALKSEGRLLDFGCGSGVMMAAFSAVRPRWSLFGLDLDDRYLSRLRRIPGFAGLHTRGPEDAPRDHDLVTMVHSLEHVPAPYCLLRAIREMLAPGGRLFVQVPDAGENPFDLVVADHMSHFTRETLARTVTSAGFAVERLETGWIRKELSLLARPVETGEVGERLAEGSIEVELARERVVWLRALLEDAGRAAAGKPFGLFGTSINATWLYGHLDDAVEFFVDEDPARAGRRHMQRPIWRPEQAPQDAVVYLALIPAVARAVRERLRNLRLDLRLPPVFPAPA